MKKLAIYGSVVVAAAALVLGAPAGAASISGLFNTGVDDGGIKLAVGTADTHYLLNGAATPFVYSNSAYPVFSDAGFLSVQADGGYVINPNVYTLTFSLAGFNAASASLGGTFFGDDTTTVSLNGILLATNTSFNSPTMFSATGGFLSGVNVLSFSVLDIFGQPSGFLVSGLTGTADVSSPGPGGVPEPTSWAIMTLGFGAVGSAMRRRRTIARLA